MMKRIVAMLMVCSVGCGTILNSGTTKITPPPGATIDGVPGPIMASTKSPHEVIYPDGRRCIVESNVSAGYVIADVLLLFLLGILVDAITGDWRTLDADACPGVSVD